MPSQLVNERYTPWIAGQKTQNASTTSGTRTNASSSGENRRLGLFSRRTSAFGRSTGGTVSATTSGGPDLLGGRLPGAQNRVDLVRLGEELQQRGVRGRLQRVAGV